MSAKRFGIESLVVLVLLLAIAGVWWVMDQRATSDLDELNSDWQARVYQLERQTARWADALAESEAEAVFRSFASGVHPLVLSDRRDGLDQAVGGLLELPGIDSVHILSASGEVLVSSDRKLETTGQVDERGVWVLATTDLVRRDSELPGITELAAPIVGPAGPAGFLWLTYNTTEVKESTRPAEPAGRP